MQTQNGGVDEFAKYLIECGDLSADLWSALNESCAALRVAQTMVVSTGTRQTSVDVTQEIDKTIQDLGVVGFGHIVRILEICGLRGASPTESARRTGLILLDIR